MAFPVFLAALWVLAVYLNRGRGRPFAWVLIALGIPVLGIVTFQHGPVLGIVCLVTGTWILRSVMLAGPGPEDGDVVRSSAE